MSSTRDLNSTANYCLEQHNRKVLQDRRFYFYGEQSRAYDPAYPELFYRQGYMPPDNFSHNPTDIESALFGVGANNLVNPKAPVNPQFKSLPTVPFFKTPRKIEPLLFFPLKDQRPNICK